MKKLLLQAAISAALDDERKNYKLGALAIRDDGKIVTSINGRTKIPEASVHAEARVLRKAGLGSVLYVARVTNTGKLALAKPCHACMTCIINKRVKKVYYTINDNEYGVLDLC